MTRAIDQTIKVKLSEEFINMRKRINKLKKKTVKDEKLLEQFRSFDWKLADKVIVCYRKRCFLKQQEDTIISCIAHPQFLRQEFH